MDQWTNIKLALLHKLRDTHSKVVLKILAYIKSSLRKWLFYKKNEHVHVTTFSNARYVGDKSVRKSTTEYFIFVGNNLVT